MKYALEIFNVGGIWIQFFNENDITSELDYLYDGQTIQICYLLYFLLLAAGQTA